MSLEKSGTGPSICPDIINDPLYKYPFCESQGKLSLVLVMHKLN